MAGPNLQVDDAGNVWDMSSGKPVFVHGPQSAGGPQTIIPAPPAKPEFVPDHPNMVYTPGQGVQTLPGVPAPAAPAPNFVPGKPGYVVTGPPDAPKAVPVEGLPAGSNIDLNAAQRAAALQQYSFAQQLHGVIDDLVTKYKAGPGATKGIRGAQDYLPLTQNKEFDAAADAARGIIGQTLGFTGSQLNTEHESEMNIGPYLPHSSDRDAVIQDKITRLRNLAAQSEQNAVRTLGGVPDAQGVVHPVPQSAKPNIQHLPGSGDQTTFATGKTRDIIDPTLKATGQRVGAMISSGVPDAQIIDFLRKSGVDPANTNIDKALQFRGTPAFKQWQQQNPGRAYPIGPEFYTKQIPMSGLRQTVNRAAASDIGGSALAAGAGATNAIMGDRLGSAVGALTGEPGTAQTAMQMLSSRHPAADLVGNIAGQAAMEGMAAGAPGLAKIMVTPWGRRAFDAAYGAYYGSGDNAPEGDAGLGAATGALVNTAGGMFGRGAQKAAGGMLGGVKNAALQYLDNRGVPLTIGQIGHGSNNMAGHIIGGLEDRFTGLPGFDAVIGGARKRGEAGFNQAAFREAGGSGATGAPGLAELATNRDNAYSFLNPLNIPLDAPFAGSQAGVRASIPGMAAFGDEVGKGIDQIDRVSTGGVINGRDWQSALRDTRANRASIAGQPFASDAQNALGGVEQNLLDLTARQVPGSVDKLNAANRLHAQVETLAGALDNGPTQQADQLFTPTRLDNVSRTNARKYGGRLASLTGANRPFYQLSQSGMEVMPSAVKDSGTAGRMWLVPLTTSAIGGSVGAATGEDNRIGDGQLGAEYGGLLGLAAMGPYSKVGQKIIQKALLADRPDRMVKIGDYLINRAPVGGMFGAGGARQYFFQPPLAQ